MCLMFEAGKGLECLANDARISVTNFEEKHWTVLLENLTKHEPSDLDHLKEVLTTCREQISQDLINNATDQWQNRISQVIRAVAG